MFFLKSRVSEMRVKRIRVNQGVGLHGKIILVVPEDFSTALIKSCNPSAISTYQVLLLIGCNDLVEHFLKEVQYHSEPVIETLGIRLVSSHCILMLHKVA